MTLFYRAVWPFEFGAGLVGMGETLFHRIGLGKAWDDNTGVTAFGAGWCHQRGFSGPMGHMTKRLPSCAAVTRSLSPG